MARKTANDVAADLRVHEKMCEERWKTIYKNWDGKKDSIHKELLFEYN